MIELSYPHRILSPNVRSHWAVVAVKRRKAKSDAFYAAKAANVTPGNRLKLTFCPPDNRVRDIDNAFASCKAALDGIAAAWGVNDREFTFALEWGEPVKGGRVLVEVLA